MQSQVNPHDLQKMTLPLLPFPLYYIPAPDGNHKYLVHLDSLDLFGKARKYEQTQKNEVTTIHGEKFIAYAAFLGFLMALRPVEATPAAEMKAQFMSVFYKQAANQAFPITLDAQESKFKFSLLMSEPLAYLDSEKYPRPVAYKTSPHWSEAPNTYSVEAQKAIAAGVPPAAAPVIDPVAHLTKPDLDYSGVKTEQQLRNQTEEDLKPVNMNRGNPAPVLVPKGSKPGTPGTFIIPQDRTGANPFANPTRDRKITIPDGDLFVVLYETVDMAIESCKTLADCATMVQRNARVAEEDNELHVLNSQVIVVGMQGEVYELVGGQKAGAFVPTDKWGPFQLGQP